MRLLIRKMAFDTVSRADNVPARLFQAAHLLRSGAAGMKITPLRRIKRGGDFSGKRHGHLMQASGIRHGLKEGLGIGVPCAVEFISSEFLDNFAEIHDQNAAAQAARYAAKDKALWHEYQAKKYAGSNDGYWHAIQAKKYRNDAR